MSTNCNAVIERNEDGTTDLIIRVPWDDRDLINHIQNAEAGKKSVTLCSGSIVADREARNPLPVYAEFGGYRVAVKGTVNLWCSKPDGKGTTSAARKSEAQLQAELAIARAEREANMFTLETPLCDKYGNVIAKAGESLLRETLGNKLLGGCYLMPVAQFKELYPQETTTPNIVE